MKNGTCTYQSINVIFFVIVLSVPTAVADLTDLDIPDRPTRSYVDLGDINLGGLFSISSSMDDSQCGRNLRLPILQQMIESVVFAVNQINQDETLLPRVKLGFALLDECGRESISASQALRFLPRVPQSSSRCCRTQNLYNTYDQKLDEYYDVVGILGPLQSSNSVAVSYVLGPARVPQISFLSTSDVLSRKSIHPYFLRVVPADTYQMEAILKFISLHGWSFFSILYVEGSYGEPAYEVIKKKVSQYGLCIAAQHKLNRDMLLSDYKAILGTLDQYKNARVVLLVAGDGEMKKTFQAVHEMKLFRRFIWVGSDGWAERVVSLNPAIRYTSLGAFTTTFYAPFLPEFNTYFRNLKPGESKSPWFHQYWEQMFNCSFKLRTCKDFMDVTQNPDYTVVSQVAYGIDAVYTYAHAIHNLLEERCPGLTGARARACVNGLLLLQYLKNVSFHGYTGSIDFNENGDRNGKYVIRQVVPGDVVSHEEIATVDVKNSFQIELTNQIVWNYVLVNPVDSVFGSKARFPRTPFQTDGIVSPISVCSRLCERGEQKVLKEPSCCWDCRHCRVNEILVSNFTSCQECPPFHWPDGMTDFTSCYRIERTYPKTSDPIVVILICLSATGLLLTALVLYYYVRHRNARVIKASSRELSFFQLGAIFQGYFTVLVYAMRPSDVLCVTSYFMFCLSFNWLYAPLLVKTIRIYRIFESANKGRGNLRAVSPFSQVAITLFIIFGQIVICFFIRMFSEPHARLKSISQTEPYVELYCEYTGPGLVSFIAYNLTLVCLCTVFAFKTRKLPDNFNESRFISSCIFTTLIIWLAIVPSFATASKEYLRMLLLAAALLLNQSVALLFLFATRIYAILYVNEIVTELAVCATNASNFQVRPPNNVTPTPMTITNAIALSDNHLKPGPSH